MTSIYKELDFVVLVPSCCSVPFAMLKSTMAARRNDKKTWYCPNCRDGRWFPGETDAQKLVREATERATAAEREAAHARSGMNEINKQLVKMRTRVRQGMCPCCDVKFDNLAEHMRQLHPEFADRQLLRVFREAYGMTQSQLGAQIGVSAATISLFENGLTVSSKSKQLVAHWLSGQVNS